MGCTHTNATMEDPNGRHSKDLTPKSKPKQLGGGKSQWRKKGT
jgi:hypothetical protein